MFKKLALVTAIAALPVSGFAMEALEDTALSDVTGQDGISLSIDLNSTMTLGIEDVGGFAGNTGSGLIIIDGMTLGGTANVVIDSASAASGGGVIQIGVSIPGTLTVDTGDIYVGQGSAAAGLTAVTGLANMVSETAAVIASPNGAIIDSVGIDIVGMSLNIQLGSEASNLVQLAGSPFNVTIGTLGDANDSFTLNDLSGGASAGSLIVDQVYVNNVDVNGVTINVRTGGLVITTPATLADMSVAAMGVKLGTTASASIGNVYVTGLNMSNQSITVFGH